MKLDQQAIADCLLKAFDGCKLLGGNFGDTAAQMGAKAVIAHLRPNPGTVIRCRECDNGIDTEWCHCPWCGITLERGNFHILTDGPNRFVLADDRDDQPAPVFETCALAEAALEQRVAEAYAD